MSNSAPGCRGWMCGCLGYCWVIHQEREEKEQALRFMSLPKAEQKRLLKEAKRRQKLEDEAEEFYDAGGRL